MRVGLMADTHDRVPAIAELLRRMTESGVGLVLHAGDFCAPFSLGPFRTANVPLAGIFGRNDGDREGLGAFARRGMGIELYESPHSVEVGGKRILLVHELAEVREQSIEAHDFVIHGYTHAAEVRTAGTAVVVNPGEACGWLRGTPTAAILDLDSKQVEALALTGPEWRF
jgi:uncharacterized protein